MPDTVYLSPEPGDLFKALIEQMARRFPNSPPYGGRFAEIIPHLTVAHSQDLKIIEKVMEDFALAAVPSLPLSARLEELWLMDNLRGRWEKRVRLPLGFNGLPAV